MVALVRPAHFILMHVHIRHNFISVTIKIQGRALQKAVRFCRLCLYDLQSRCVSKQCTAELPPYDACMRPCMLTRIKHNIAFRNLAIIPMSTDGTVVLGMPSAQNSSAALCALQSDMQLYIRILRISSDGRYSAPQTLQTGSRGEGRQWCSRSKRAS